MVPPAQLVAHEYGHVVEDFLNTAVRNNSLGSTATEQEYAELRGLPLHIDAGGGGHWHDKPGEVMANDFRLLVCGVEPEYWPHPGIPRPEGNTQLIDWWQRAEAACRELQAKTE